MFPAPAEDRAAKRTANEKRTERMRCFITCDTAGTCRAAGAKQGAALGRCFVCALPRATLGSLHGSECRPVCLKASCSCRL